MPGNGSVEISIGDSCLGDSTSIESLSIWNFAPISVNFLISIGRWFGLIPTILPFPFVDKNAPIYVPATIRSPMTLWFVLFNAFTPLITISLLPSPVMSAPIFFNIFIRSTTSGSRAAFSITVVPSARTAAKSVFSVAPTDA